MPDMTLITGAIASLRMANDIAKGLVAIRDETLLNQKALELQRIILAAQSDALSAQSDQLALLQRITDLEKELAAFDKWDTEKEKYELNAVTGSGMLAYMLKPDARGAQPPHWLCTNCYENRKPSMLQFFGQAGRDLHFKCHACSAGFRTHGEQPTWL